MKTFKHGDWVQLTAVPTHLKELVEQHKSVQFQILGRRIAANNEVSYFLHVSESNKHGSKLSSLFSRGGGSVQYSKHQEVAGCKVVEIKSDALLPYSKKIDAPATTFSAGECFNHEKLGIQKAISISPDGMVTYDKNQPRIPYSPSTMDRCSYQVGDTVSISQNHYDVSYYAKRYSKSNQYKIVGIANNGVLAVTPVEKDAQAAPQKFPPASFDQPYVSYMTGEFPVIKLNMKDFELISPAFDPELEKMVSEILTRAETQKIEDAELVELAELAENQDRQMQSPPETFRSPEESKSTFKDHAIEAGYRIAAKKIGKGARDLIIAIFKAYDLSNRQIKFLMSMLDTPYGQSFVSMALGNLLQNLKPGDHRLEKICEELRIEGMALTAETLMADIWSVLTPIAFGALANLPAVAQSEQFRVTVEEATESSNDEEEIEETVNSSIKKSI